MSRFFFAVTSLSLFVVATLSAEISDSGKLLLKESFDKKEGSEFSKKLLQNKYIELSQGNGPDGSDAIRVAYVGYARGSQRVVFHHQLREQVDQATLSFDVRFDKDFQWVLGGKLHGLGPKNPVTGGNERRPDRWSARIMFKEDGKCQTYLYDQDKTKKWGRGEKTDNPVFEAGKWHHVVLQVGLNDPGKNNGFAHVWIDGKKVLSTEGVIYREVSTLDTKIQKLLFSTFHGGNQQKWTPVDDKGNPTTVYAYFDNFMVTQGITQHPVHTLSKD